jgi:thiol:disulfide interchange protein DsbD
LSKRRKKKAHRRSHHGKNNRTRDTDDGSNDRESSSSDRVSDNLSYEERPVPRSSVDFKARQRKHDILFVIFIVILGAGMFSGYFLYNNVWDTGADDNDDLYGDINVQNGAPNDVAEPDEEIIKWNTYDAGLQLAAAQNKPVLIDFYYDTCYYCIELDKNTYTDSRVIEQFKNFVPIKVDLYEEKAYDGQALVNQYGVTGYPTIVFQDVSGTQIHRIIGYKGPGPFLEDMEFALKNS